MKNIFKEERGLSLVEMSISVTLIGLMIAGTLGGMSLLNASKLRKVVTEYTGYINSINEFTEEYHYYPGDMPNASSYWSGANNGDGDTYIEFAETTNGTPKEDLFAWEHLSNSDLISSSYTGANVSASVRYGAKVNAPTSDGFENGVYMFHTESNSGGNIVYNTIGLTIRLGGIGDVNFGGGAQGSYPLGGVMTAKNAYSIDKKMDDGVADSGSLYVVRSMVTGDSGCTDAVWSSSGAAFVLGSSEKTCNLIYWYRKY